MVKKLLPVLAIAFLFSACGYQGQTLEECLAGTHHSSFALLSCQAQQSINAQFNQ